MIFATAFLLVVELDPAAPARTLLAVAAAGLFAAAVTTPVIGWAVRVICRRQLRATAEQLAAVREEANLIRIEMGRKAAIAEQLSARVGHLAEAVVRRLDQLEQRQIELEQKVDQAATAEAIVARAVGGGTVHQLRPNVSTSEPRWPR